MNIKYLLSHKLILAAIGAIVLIGAGSIWYYISETKKPAQVALPVSTAGAQDITASGVVAPLENPDLSFEASGRITYLAVSVGDRVYTGQVLATLDTAALSAQRDQAQANVKAQQAKLDELKAGARDTDIAVRQAVVDAAQQVRASAYAGLPSAISDAFAKGQDAVYTTADPLFSNPNTANPTLIFNTSDTTRTNAAASGRIAAGAELQTWKSELAALGTMPSESDLDAAVVAALGHLAHLRDFEDSMSAALSAAVTTNSFTASSVATAQASVSAARTSLNGLVTSLTAQKQAILSDTISISSAQANLDQLKAGASAQDIAAQEAAVESAQAAVDAVNAQISNNVISAPFGGVVGSVSVKRGDIVTPNTEAITILPDSNLDVEVLVSELDAARITKGDAADVTLDAYGSARTFSAHVSQVAAAPTGTGANSGYQVKLSFDAPDAAIKSGMTANAIIHTSAK